MKMFTKGEKVIYRKVKNDWSVEFYISEYVGSLADDHVVFRKGSAVVKDINIVSLQNVFKVGQEINVKGEKKIVRQARVFDLVVSELCSNLFEVINYEDIVYVYTHADFKIDKELQIETQQILPEVLDLLLQLSMFRDETGAIHIPAEEALKIMKELDGVTTEKETKENNDFNILSFGASRGPAYYPVGIK